MKIAVIFHRLGPYHFARLRKAGGLLPITAIETSGVDETYAWDTIGEAGGFERVTLFENADAHKQPAREVSRLMMAALDKIQPQIVVVPGWSDPAALAAVKWSTQNQVPTIVMSESTAWDEKRSAWREAVKRQIVGLGSAALVGGTPHRDYMVKMGMPAERIFLGYDAVDNGYFKEKAEKLKTEILKSEGGSQKTDDSTLPSAIRHLPSSPFFLASARFVEKKNLPRLLQAFALYRKKAETLPGEAAKQTLHGPRKAGDTSTRSSPQGGEGVVPWDLVLLGDGPLRETLNAQLSTLNLQAHVQMPGFKQYPDLPAYYAHAGAFIHASTTEQWGLVVNEAMAGGLPVLVSNRCGCAQDLVQEGVNGFTFDPYNVEQLADLMLRVAGMERGGGATETPKHRLAKMGAASQRIISAWGPERFALGLKSAVEMAMEVGPKRATLLQRTILKILLNR